MKELQAIKPEDLKAHITALIAEPKGKSRFILDDPDFPMIIEIDVAQEELALFYKRKSIGFWWWWNSLNRATDKAKKILDLIQPQENNLQIQEAPSTDSDRVRYSPVCQELTSKEYNVKKSGGFYGFSAWYLQSEVPQTVTSVTIAGLLIALAITLYVLPFMGFAIASLSMLALAITVAAAIGGIVYKIIDKIREIIRSNRISATAKINHKKGIEPKTRKVPAWQKLEEEAVQRAEKSSNLFSDIFDAIVDIRGSAKEYEVSKGQIKKDLVELHDLIAEFVKNPVVPIKLNLVQENFKELVKILLPLFESDPEEAYKMPLIKLLEEAGKFLNISISKEEGLAGKPAAAQEAPIDTQVLSDDFREDLIEYDGLALRQKYETEEQKINRLAKEQKINKLANQCMANIWDAEKNDFSNYLDQFSNIDDQLWFLRSLREKVGSKWFLSAKRDELKDKIDEIETKLIVDSKEYQEKKGPGEGPGEKGFKFVLNKLLSGKPHEEQINILEKMRDDILQAPQGASPTMYKPGTTPQHEIYLKCLKLKFEEVVANADAAEKYQFIQNQVEASAFRKTV